MKVRSLIQSAIICGSALGFAWQSQAQTAIEYPTPATYQRVGKITGATVTDAQGKALGTIQDLIADRRTGNIDFAIVALDTPDTRGRDTAVPWTLLRPSGPNTFTLNASPDTLRTAGSFPADQYPDFSRESYGQLVYTHYGLIWPAAQTAQGGYAPAQESQRGYESGTRPWDRPQPDGHETFPWLDHSQNQ